MNLPFTYIDETRDVPVEVYVNGKITNSLLFDYELCLTSVEGLVYLYHPNYKDKKIRVIKLYKPYTQTLCLN